MDSAPGASIPDSRTYELVFFDFRVPGTINRLWRARRAWGQAAEVERLWPGRDDRPAGRCGGDYRVSVSGSAAQRVPFAGRGEDFDWITDAALRAAAQNPDNAFGAVLGLLAGRRPSLAADASEGRGPTYAQLRAVADAMGMGAEQAEDWELLAESIPISERHVLCILGSLAEVAA